MPLVEFNCPECDRDFEEFLRSMRDVRKVVCPSCGCGSVSRKLSVFSARSASPGPSAGASACGRCGDPNGPCGM